MDELINSFLIESDNSGNVRIQAYGLTELEVLHLLLKRERQRQKKVEPERFSPKEMGKVIQKKVKQ